MKKAFFSLAIMAMGLLMASCGNKNAANDNGEQQDSVATEQADNENLVENEYYSVVKPSDWEVNKTYTDDTDICLKPSSPEKFGRSEEVRFILREKETESDSYIKTFEEYLGEFYKGKTEPGEDVTFAGITFKQVKFNGSFGKHCLLIAQTPKGVLEFEISSKLTPDTPDVKAILESFKMK